MKDGDLWQKLLAAVKEKGPWSVWVTKVKGHATDEDVGQGIAKVEDKEGNDNADKAADKGAKDKQEKLPAVASLHARRAKEYQQLTRRIQNSICNIEKDEKELREQRDRRRTNCWHKRQRVDQSSEKIRIC